MKRNYSEITRKSGIACVRCLCCRRVRAHTANGELCRMDAKRSRMRSEETEMFGRAAAAAAMAKTIVGSLGLQFRWSWMRASKVAVVIWRKRFVACAVVANESVWTGCWIANRLATNEENEIPTGIILVVPISFACYCLQSRNQKYLSVAINARYIVDFDCNKTT